MSLKNSQTIEDLKHEYIYGSVHKDGRRSFKSLDNLIKSLSYRHQLFIGDLLKNHGKINV